MQSSKDVNNTDQQIDNQAFDLPIDVVVSLIRFYRIKPVFLSCFCLNNRTLSLFLSISKKKKLCFKEMDLVILK